MSVEEIEHEIQCEECRHRMKVKIKKTSYMSINTPIFFFERRTFICEACGSLIEVGSK